jgi:type I restriction enzyme, R subunit
MRPVNSMIEFKQIIGRGTRLYDGKAYFTIYDFVRAHQHFSDPEWDGEPLDNTTKDDEDEMARRKRPRNGGGLPDNGGEGEPPRPRPAKIKIKLADGKERTIQHMMMTSFWHPDGTPMSAQQFMEMLYGKLPEYFKNEQELREIWSEPETRAQLLEGLAEKGFGKEQMTEMQKVIDAENSDLFDVLAHVAYALAPLTREERASQARAEISTRFTTKQQVFLEFVLSHYVSVGVEELASDKLSPLLRLKYNNSIPDAVAQLGEAPQIRKVFSSFQRFLYQGTVQ